MSLPTNKLFAEPARGEIYTPLLDGPQLGTCWAARYASGLEDGPGSAVITLSSYGMGNVLDQMTGPFLG